MMKCRLYEFCLQSCHPCWQPLLGSFYIHVHLVMLTFSYTYASKAWRHRFHLQTTILHVDRFSQGKIFYRKICEKVVKEKNKKALWQWTVQLGLTAPASWPQKRPFTSCTTAETKRWWVARPELALLSSQCPWAVIQHLAGCPVSTGRVEVLHFLPSKISRTRVAWHG